MRGGEWTLLFLLRPTVLLSIWHFTCAAKGAFLDFWNIWEEKIHGDYLGLIKAVFVLWKGSQGTFDVWGKLLLVIDPPRCLAKTFASVLFYNYTFYDMIPRNLIIWCLWIFWKTGKRLFITFSTTSYFWFESNQKLQNLISTSTKLYIWFIFKLR